MSVICHATLAQAMLDLSEQVIAKYGADPETVRGLRFTAKRTPHLGSRRSGITLIAYPIEGIRSEGDILAAYYGDPPRGRLEKLRITGRRTDRPHSSHKS